MKSQSQGHSNSPFRPGYSRAPLVFGGHVDTIEEFTNVFVNYDIGENQSILISGLRGAGKTSMLGVMQELAESAGWITISDDAGSGLMNRVMNTTIPTILNSVDEATRVRLSGLGVWQFNAAFEYVDRRREVTPLLRSDLIALSEATENRGILILIDEVASGKIRLKELSRFALEVSNAIAAGINIVVAFAGVKIDLDELLNQAHMTFLRRSREIDFRRLSPADTRKVLRETTELGGRRMDLNAEELLVSVTQGYPYLIQLAGDYAWRASPQSESISLADAEAAQVKAIAGVERRVIRRVYQDLSEKDQRFLQAMSVDEGKSKMADISKRMEVTPQYTNQYRIRLIDSGYVHTVEHGYVDFSLPYLRDYVRSVVAAEERPEATAGRPDGWDEFPPPALR
ncbi:ATP-binding protein [Arthrobacter sp. H20]|uniref:ATP-binding protein n=1 Tax=Arthrobacter sp. H20 TaxID=1267981 RepID=UPI00047AE015|nr:ATP-binding protein [Arthrobacter sp. H20]